MLRQVQHERIIINVFKSTPFVLRHVEGLLKRFSAATAEAVNDSLKNDDDALSGILNYCDEPLASSDFRGNPASSIVDALSIVVMEGKMAKVLSWYDNEWGYSCRAGDLATFMAEQEL